jgi:hypothetical protein
VRCYFRGLREFAELSLLAFVLLSAGSEYSECDIGGLVGGGSGSGGLQNTSSCCLLDLACDGCLQFDMGWHVTSRVCWP